MTISSRSQSCGWPYQVLLAEVIVSHGHDDAGVVDDIRTRISRPSDSDIPPSPSPSQASALTASSSACMSSIAAWLYADFLSGPEPEAWSDRSAEL